MAPTYIAQAVPNGRPASPAKKTATDSTKELFDKLEINDKSASPRRAPPQPVNGSSDRPENVPPKRLPNGLGRMLPSGHRPSHSEEERRRNGGKPRAVPGGLDIFADPPDPNKLRERKTRRNSESSVRDKKLLDPEDEKRREERRRRHERRKPKPERRLDIIDKLDVTSIYGMGCEYNLVYSLCRSSCLQCSIMTVRSMLATPLETARMRSKPRCKRFPKIPAT